METKLQNEYDESTDTKQKPASPDANLSEVEPSRQEKFPGKEDEKTPQKEERLPGKDEKLPGTYQ